MNTKKSFPSIETIQIDVIAPVAGGKVYPDFEREILKLGQYAKLIEHFTEVGISTDLDPETRKKRTQEYSKKIANIIKNKCNGDILAIIRGGGNGYEFKVYGEPEIIEAFRSSSAYKVIGIGHSHNFTKLDEFSDVVESTPGQAGVYIREHHQKNIDRINANKNPPASIKTWELNKPSYYNLASKATCKTSTKMDVRLKPKSSTLWIITPIITTVAVIGFFAWQPKSVPKPSTSKTLSPVTEKYPKTPHHKKQKASTAPASPSSQPKNKKTDQERIAERLHAVESGTSLAPAPMFNQGTE